MRWIFTFLFLVMASGVGALGLPEAPTVGGALGVNVHGFGPGVSLDDGLARVRAAGFGWVRTDVRWAEVERSKGVYDWRRTDLWVHAMGRTGVRPVLVLGGPAPAFYVSASVAIDPVTRGEVSKTAGPVGMEAVRAYAAWARAAAARYKAAAPVWELWNEPNNAYFWPPTTDARAYVRLAGAACVAMRKADPAAVVVAPALAYADDFTWKDDFVAGIRREGGALLGCMDAFSVHPYQTPTTPDKVAEALGHVRAALGADYANMPLALTEWGFSTYTRTWRTLTEEGQAAALVRQHLTNLLAGARLSLWYNWRDKGTNAAVREYHYGLVTRESQAKPALEAATAMVRLLGDFTVTGGGMMDARVMRIQLTNARGERAWALWSVGGKVSTPALLALPVGACVPRVFDLMGKALDLPTDGQVLQLRVGAPVYVMFGACAG